ncbi:MAG: adenylosuccinate lyase [Vicinamibacteria bacterium]
MIPRYSRPEMSKIWSDENRFSTWLKIELAATDAMSRRGVVPKAARDVLFEKSRFDVARIDAIEKEVGHDVIAFVSAVVENVGPEGRFLHYGLTSSDVVDTSLSILMRDALDLLLSDLDGLREAVKTRAIEHKNTVMIGRTHGVHAEPMTFGLKLALWYDQLSRDRKRLLTARAEMAVGKLSGAVGTFSHLGPDVEAEVCKDLGLTPAPIASQVVPRDRHAQVMTTLAILAGSLETFATEIRSLQKTEFREVEEPFGEKQKGSSAMPHKRNPIGCEQVVGLARIVRANSLVSMENMALWHERDISHSSAERVAVPDSFLALDHMLRRFTGIVKGMRVDEARMRRNLDAGKGLVFSGQLLLELTEKGGMQREDAYKIVQGHAMDAFLNEGDFKAEVFADEAIVKTLGKEELERVFELTRYLQHTDTLFARVFEA